MLSLKNSTCKSLDRMRRFFVAFLFVGTGVLLRAQQTPAPPPKAAPQSITVTADRGLANVNDSATSVAILPQAQLQQAPGLTLDDQLHQVAGFQLFRRTSSSTANPTTEGISLRGLGSTAASRTLVLSDEVSLNDPFGGWVHWDEIPQLAIDRVELLRGGASDLYGSSAIGGVINVVPTRPTTPLLFETNLTGATENSALEDALFSGAFHRIAALGAFSGIQTGGYIPTAPAIRGLVDIPSNVNANAARTEFDLTPAKDTTAFLRGNVLNESRSNGTPDQTNATRLWRYVGGADANPNLSHYALRLFGTRESYRQSFSSIAASRNTETLTKLQQVPLDELGLVAQASRILAHNLTAALGFDVNDLRATDNETTVSTRVTASTAAHQRETGGYADAIWQPQHWSLSGSIRIDSFRTYDARTISSNSATITTLPQINELVASPRLGLVRQLPKGLALFGTGFRAFRGPTMNELYRTGQVGSQTTLANSSLLAERATGFEFGGELTGRPGHLRASYFWTEVNRPISAILLSQTATTQTLQRQNLGQIRSRGLSLEAQSQRWHRLDATFGYQFAYATVTAFSPTGLAATQPSIVGNQIPQVPRQSVTTTANYLAPRLANFHLIASYTGPTFDDAANQFVLHPYARFDLSADRDLGHGLSLTASAQNLLNRTIDAGRTPTLTLAAPRLVQGGIRVRLTR
jgi:outer membrane receptor protein involved in Fe transport